MRLAHITSEVGVVEIAVAFAAMAYVVERVLDALGWSKSSRTLRAENTDLVRHNSELEREVDVLREKVAALTAEVDRLRADVGELSQRDQLAVLQSMEAHEDGAVQRWEETLKVLREIRDK